MTSSRSARLRAYPVRAPQPNRRLRSWTGQVAVQRPRRATPERLHWQQSMIRLDATQAHRSTSWPSTELVRLSSAFPFNRFQTAQAATSCLKLGTGRPAESQRKFHVANVWLCGIGLHVKSELAAHGKHDRIFLQHVPRDCFQSLGSGVLDNQLHQCPAKAPCP